MVDELLIPVLLILLIALDYSEEGLVEPLHLYIRGMVVVYGACLNDLSDLAYIMKQKH